MKNPLETLSEPRIGCVQHDCDNCKAHRDILVRHLAEIERLRGEVEALKADAERLDWLCSEESDALTAPTDNQRYLTAEAWERLADCTGVYSKSQKIATIDAARSK